MSIPIICPKCATKYSVKDESAGKRARCKCGTTITVPSPPNQPHTEPEPPSFANWLDEELHADLFAGVSTSPGGAGVHESHGALANPKTLAMPRWRNVDAMSSDFKRANENMAKGAPMFDRWTRPELIVFYACFVPLCILSVYLVFFAWDLSFDFEVPAEHVHPGLTDELVRLFILILGPGGIAAIVKGGAFIVAMLAAWGIAAAVQDTFSKLAWFERLGDPNILKDRWSYSIGLTLELCLGCKNHFSAESITFIERLLEFTHAEYKESGRDYAVIARGCGAYIVKVFERNLGPATWSREASSDDNDTFPLQWRGTTLFPVEWCMRRITEGPAENVWDKFQSAVGGPKNKKSKA
jgi:hypothetical protein